ncbi:MAG: dihydrofolate reductase family protein [Thermoplasmata archaeon]
MTRKRKIIVWVATSADGFIARPDGSVAWLDRPRPKGDYGMPAFYRSIDTCILGRRTYELSVRLGSPDGYAGKTNYVFSRRWNATASPRVQIVHEDVLAFAKRLRATKGKHIWLVGGGEQIASFLDAGQVDEFILNVIPKPIGAGIPLVAPRHRDLRLKLLASKKFADGQVQLHYAVEK